MGEQKLDHEISQEKLEKSELVSPLGTGDASDYLGTRSNKDIDDRRAIQRCTLQICVTRGVGLSAMDALGTSDPYLRVALVHADDLEETERLEVPDGYIESQVVFKTLDPLWNFYWMFMEEDLSEHYLFVEVWDKDRIKADDFMGRVVLRVSDVMPSNTWHPLRPRTGAKAVDGHLQVMGQYRSAEELRTQLAQLPTPLVELTLLSDEMRMEEQLDDNFEKDIRRFEFVDYPATHIPSETWARSVEEMCSSISPPMTHPFVIDAYKCLSPGTVLRGHGYAKHVTSLEPMAGPFRALILGLIPDRGLIKCFVRTPAGDGKNAYIKFIAHHYRTNRVYSRSVLSMVIYDKTRYYCEGPVFFDRDSGVLGLVVPGRCKEMTLPILQRSDLHWSSPNTNPNPAKSWKWTHKMYEPGALGALTSPLVVSSRLMKVEKGTWKKVMGFFRESSQVVIDTDVTAGRIRFTAEDQPPEDVAKRMRRKPAKAAQMTV